MSGKRQADEVVPTQQYTRARLATPENSGGSDVESSHSSQQYDSVVVKDTSDASSSPPNNIEYEVIDLEEQKPKFYQSDDSDEDFDLKFILGTVPSDNIDVALFGDTSEENSTSPTSNSDVDPGLPRNDYLDFEKCALCKTDKKDISYPYCSECFLWKKNYFPCRPKRQQSITKKDKTQATDSDKNINISSVQSEQPVNFKDSENKQKLIRAEVSGNIEELHEGNGVSSSGSQLSVDIVDGPSTSRGVTLDMCRVCFSKPENGLFIHTNAAHVYGCYGCAKKIGCRNGCCPICRRKIFKVAKLYV